MKPQISIITPSYNQVDFIEETIQSVLSQNITNLEYLVFDGGSTDGTVDVLRKYSGKLKWESEKDGGQTEAINKGILQTTAPILGWLNSDDIYYPNALSIALEYFIKHPDIDGLYGDANHIDANSEFLSKYPTEIWNWEQFKEVCFISQPAAFVRTNVFSKYGLLNSNFRGADYEYWLRLGKKQANFLYVPELLAATRLHKSAFTIASKIEVHTEMNNMTKQILGKTPDKWVFNYAHAVADEQSFSRQEQFTYAIIVSLVSWYAMLRWNRSISLNVMKTTFLWISSNFSKKIGRK